MRKYRAPQSITPEEAKGDTGENKNDDKDIFREEPKGNGEELKGEGTEGDEGNGEGT